MINIVLSLCIYFGAIFTPAFIVYAIKDYQKKQRKKKIKKFIKKYEPSLLSPATIASLVYSSKYCATTRALTYDKIIYENMLKEYEKYKEKVIKAMNEGDK